MYEQKLYQAASSPRKSFPYLQYTPQNVKEGEKLPLLIFLHGAGERGDDLDLVARHGYFKHARAGKEYPFSMVGPQCPADKSWGCYIESLNEFLDYILRTLPVDPDRVYLTGLSMGGTGTWMWSIANPERFAAVAPVCGTGIYWYAGQLLHKPLWVFHGDKDDICLPIESINMVESIRRRGGNPRFTLYPGVGHNAWEQAYSDPELVKWFTEQKRSSN